MRTTLIISTALVAAWIAWMAWPLAALYGLARAVEARDVPAVMQNVNVVSVYRYLTDQIVGSYEQATGTSAHHNALSAMITTSILDPLVAGMITPEKFVTMLHDGWVDSSLVERPPDARGLSRRALGGWWQAFLASEQDFDRYSISFPTVKPMEQRFTLRFRLRAWRWQLREVILPQDLRNRLARTLAKQQPPRR